MRFKQSGLRLRTALRRHVLRPRRKNNIYGSQQKRVRHLRRAIQIAGESPIRDAELQSCRFNVAHLGDYVLKNGLPGGVDRHAVNLNDARFLRLYGSAHSGFALFPRARSPKANHPIKSLGPPWDPHGWLSATAECLFWLRSEQIRRSDGD